MLLRFLPILNKAELAYVMNINRGKAKIKFMYVGAALSLMAVPNAAKPTS